MRSLIEDEPRKAEVEIPPDGISLDLLRAIYRNSSLGLPVRMRAAIAALPHEAPKLQVTAMVSDQGLAELLERRLTHLEAVEHGNGKPIEHQPAVETTKPIPRLADRRYRRL